jgi:group I intron endonuclease
MFVLWAEKNFRVWNLGSDKNIGRRQRSMSVYKITNTINGKAYVGQTVNSIQERFRTHCATSSEGKCPALWAAIQNYGKDKFTIELLWSEPGCTREVLDDKEIDMIAEHDTISPNGYNLMSGGHGARHNDESRKKISEAKKKLWEEKGDEIRAQIKERGVSDETRQRMSEACIRKYQEHPELKEYSKHRKGAVHTEETRAKMVEAWERRKQDPNFHQVFIAAFAHTRKPVYIFDKTRVLIQVAESLTKAAEFIGGYKGALSTSMKKGALLKKKYYASYTAEPPEPKTRPEKTIYCFDKDRNLVDTCRSLEEVNLKTGFSMSGVLKNGIKGGKLYKNQFYFSYSAEPPPVPAVAA